MIGKITITCLAAVILVAAALQHGARAQSVTGVAQFRERVLLEPEAVFEAVLQDISLADAPAVDIGHFRAEGLPGPAFEFEIPYDPDVIEERNSYSVRATIRVGDELQFTSDTVHPVLTRNAPDHVEITMIMVGGSGEQAADGGGELVQIDVKAAAETEPAGTTEGAGAQSAGAASGEAEAAGDEAPEDTDAPMRGMVALVGDGAVFTECRSGTRIRVLTEGDYQALEHAYLAAGQEPGLPLMARFEGKLQDEGQSVRVDRFIGVWPDETCEEAVTEIGLTNVYWRIVQLGDVELTKVDGQREPHMILPNEEARFTATVGCNQMIGEYMLDGASLSFGQAAATMMACPEPLSDWERKLAAVLGETAGWRIGGETLELLNASGDPIARFEAVFLN